jgi:hypothetical protein
MLSLDLHHITELYCWVDDLLPKQLPSKTGGRPPVLQHSELITLLVWNALVLRQKTIKDLHNHARIHLKREFPRLPTYQAFVGHCHRVTPLMIRLLQVLLAVNEPIKLMDSTMLPVCKTKRADSHNVAKTLAAFGKNHQGWHYGFKLHAAITPDGRLGGVYFTPANVFDAQVIPKIINNKTKIAVGDSHYGASVMRRKVWEQYGTVIIAPPHWKQKKKLATLWQNELLSLRSKIESVFDVLKEHLHLVTSFARSPFGYLVHYVRILLGYQIMALAAHSEVS